MVSCICTCDEERRVWEGDGRGHLTSHNARARGRRGSGRKIALEWNGNGNNGFCFRFCFFSVYKSVISFTQLKVNSTSHDKNKIKLVDIELLLWKCIQNIIKTYYLILLTLSIHFCRYTKYLFY